jgi:glycosyltransferase involved in cell wall biosynthesis
MQVCWIMERPSGDLLDVLRAIGRRLDLKLRVVYLTGAGVKGAESGVASTDSVHVLPHRLSTKLVRLLRVLTDPATDIIVLSGYSHPLIVLAQIFLTVTRKRWVFFGERPGVSRHLLHLPLYRLAAPVLARATGILAVGSSGVSAYRRLLSTKAPIISLPYCIDASEFLAIERRQPDHRAARFLFVGQLVERKGIRSLLRAFESVAKENPGIRLTIAGDGPLKQEVAAACERLPAVRYKGLVAYADRVCLFKDADVLVHPAIHEGWGVIIQEGMAAGLATISTIGAAAAADLVDGTRAGIVLGDQTETSLQESIASLASADRAFAMGQRGREAIRGFTPEACAERFAHFFSDL